MQPRLRRSLEATRAGARRSGHYVRERKKRFLLFFLALAHLAGAFTSIDAIMQPRSSQGAIAWAVSLNTMPYVAVPLYWFFGDSNFRGYETKRHASRQETSPIITLTVDRIEAAGFIVEDEAFALKSALVNLPATSANSVELLRGGDAIFDSILEGIDAAADYILVQFYTVRDDDLGRRLQDRLLDAAARGVRVYFIYDGIGSYQLPGAYRERMREAGIEVSVFNDLTGIFSRFQINFRNHRKMVVVDGRTAWTGGANLGDEYLGLDPAWSPWLDAKVRISGPAVQLVQISFLEDWFWVQGELLDLEWTPEAAPDGANQTVLCLPSGPADAFPACALYFLDTINTATKRLWIASPYFVPDEAIVSALQMASLRGVEVRILLPEDSDNSLVKWAGWSYVAPLEEAGVQIYRHGAGFLHYKALLKDDTSAMIGSANFDNRSFRLNFELTMEVHDPAFARSVEAMLEDDFRDARLASAEELDQRSFPVRLAVRIARLLSPLL